MVTYLLGLMVGESSFAIEFAGIGREAKYSTIPPGAWAGRAFIVLGIRGEVRRQLGLGLGSGSGLGLL